MGLRSQVNAQAHTLGEKDAEIARLNKQLASLRDESGSKVDNEQYVELLGENSILKNELKRTVSREKALCDELEKMSEELAIAQAKCEEGPEVGENEQALLTQIEELIKSNEKLK